VTVVNPVLHSKHRSAALSPDPLPANASFIRLSARDVVESQLPERIVSPKGARLVKPEEWCAFCLQTIDPYIGANPPAVSSAGSEAAARRPRHFWASADPRNARRGFDHRKDHSALCPTSAPSRIRTCGLLLRRESLYPAELSGLVPEKALLSHSRRSSAARARL
jgi:hypothetical protein